MDMLQKLALLWLVTVNSVCCADVPDRGPFAILKALLFSLKDAPSDVPRDVPSVPMRLIGAGLGRTGTSSLLGALKMLGYTPYHMKEGVIDRGHEYEWGRLVSAFEAGDTNGTAAATSALIDLMASSGFDATTDYPTCLIFKELMERYPDAKVILSVRSSGKAWAKSVLSTIGQLGPLMSARPFSFSSRLSAFAGLASTLWIMTGAELDPVTGVPTEGSLIKAYDAWTEHVIKTVPPKKLLVHESGQGFGPICAFLEIPSKDCPPEYPRINDTATLQKAMMVIRAISWIWLPVSTSMLALVLFLLRRLCRPGKVPGKEH